ncbi:MAG: hypothetical protein IKH29_05015 [Methanobrevibacter sp.]|uniref:hypothetical protein n=1 Tax=Methanobrevibacter sp. TaxID=66852 RepID=UPI0025FC9FDA|nr:hypothetical protein [Methanobrevibacter sp.]MBR3113057.1 hypothetical protein [Methanobrevibacter sp.]
MEKNNIIIIALIVLIIALSIGIFASMQNFTKTDANVETNEITSINQTASSSEVPDSITLELSEFDTKVSKTVGEYTVEAEKWRGGTVGGFGVWLYKNGQLVDKDSYLSRAYFCMNGEWKWSEWGNGEGASYHKYPVSNDVEIQEIEVKF